MNEVRAAVLGGMVAAVAAIGVTYFINFERIERPKIALEAHRQALMLSPSIGTECGKGVNSGETLHVSCSVKNNGTYPVFVKILKPNASHSSVGNVTSNSDLDWKLEGNTASEPGVLLPINGSTFYKIVLEPTKYSSLQSNPNDESLIVKLRLEASTPSEARNFLIASVPSIAPLVDRLSTIAMEVSAELAFSKVAVQPGSTRTK